MATGRFVLDIMIIIRKSTGWEGLSIFWKKNQPKERENAVENCDYEDGKISSLKSVSIGGAKGFQYSAVNCYIDYTETLLISNDNYYRVSQSYVGDEDDYNGYKQITRDIVATLNFTL